MTTPKDLRLPEKRISFRQAGHQDFEYCANIYFAEMEKIIRELNLDMQKHADGFRQRWEVEQVRIITLDDSDIGWFQIRTEGDAIFSRAAFSTSFQRQGIGTEILNRIIGEAADADQAVTLGVVKTNPALRLYERFGFQITHEDERKFYMRRESDGAVRSGCSQ